MVAVVSTVLRMASAILSADQCVLGTNYRSDVWEDSRPIFHFSQPVSPTALFTMAFLSAYRSSLLIRVRIIRRQKSVAYSLLSAIQYLASV